VLAPKFGRFGRAGQTAPYAIWLPWSNSSKGNLDLTVG
jgi:hypothetical protein